jgi:hypothetical protein
VEQRKYRKLRNSNNETTIAQRPAPEQEVVRRLNREEGSGDVAVVDMPERLADELEHTGQEHRETVAPRVRILQLCNSWCARLREK